MTDQNKKPYLVTFHRFCGATKPPLEQVSDVYLETESRPGSPEFKHDAWAAMWDQNGSWRNPTGPIPGGTGWSSVMMKSECRSLEDPCTTADEPGKQQAEPEPPRVIRPGQILETEDFGLARDLQAEGVGFECYSSGLWTSPIMGDMQFDSDKLYRRGCSPLIEADIPPGHELTHRDEYALADKMYEAGVPFVIFNQGMDTWNEVMRDPSTFRVESRIRRAFEPVQTKPIRPVDFTNLGQHYSRIQNEVLDSSAYAWSWHQCLNVALAGHVTNYDRRQRACADIMKCLFYVDTLEVCKDQIEEFRPKGKDADAPVEDRVHATLERWMNKNVDASGRLNIDPPPGERISMRPDGYEQARALHRVVRAMHDGHCPGCSYLDAASAFVRDGSHVCPACEFRITAPEADAALKEFAPYLKEGYKVFMDWRLNRGLSDQGLTGKQPKPDVCETPGDNT